LIRQGDFSTADKLLGQHIYSNGKVSRYAQFTSLPGGAEHSRYWNDPTLLALYGADGNAADNPIAFALAQKSQQACSAVAASGFSDFVYTPPGDGIATGDFSHPIGPNAPVTSEFGGRQHPVLGGASFHNGIDLGVPTGTPIKATDGGLVDFAGWNKDYGWLVVIDHGNGLASWYGHNSVNTVQKGQTVTKGDIVGHVGSTGLSTGPHLDFGFAENYVSGSHTSGQPVNPRKYVDF